MSLFNRPSVQHTMFNPVRSYQKYVERLELKRKVFNPDKKTLNLQELNRFVNGTPEKLRNKPTYLRAKTRDLLWNTLVKEWGDGKYGKDLDEVANDLIAWCKSPDRAQNTNVRHWLKQLAEAKPVECPAVESVEVESVEVESVEVESAKIPTWTYAQLMKDFGDGAKSHASTATELDSGAGFREAMNGIDVAIPNDPNDAGSGTEDMGGSNKASATIDSNLPAEDVSKPENAFKYVSNTVDPRGRRPLPMLQAKPRSTQPRHVVVHMVNGEVVPVKQ